MVDFTEKHVIRIKLLPLAEPCSFEEALEQLGAVADKMLTSDHASKFQHGLNLWKDESVLRDLLPPATATVEDHVKFFAVVKSTFDNRWYITIDIDYVDN